MGSLPKPLIGLLLGTIAFFAIWMVALKPSSSSSSNGSPSGAGQYQSAINQAHQAVTTSGQANAKIGAPTATTSTKATAPVKTVAKPAAKPTRATAAKPTQATPAKPHTASAAKRASVSAAAGVAGVESAIRAGKVVALLFYNDAAPDDRAMKRELAAIPAHNGAVFKLAVPVTQLTQFSMITAQVQVEAAPTLVVIDRARQATTLIGYADGVEIAQRIDDALAATK
jgi:hypothetical protein